MKRRARRKAQGARCISLIFLILCFFSLSSLAWALDPEKEITQYVHDIWGLEDGLPQISVQAIIRTGEGYLWLGTREGLVKFDGVHFEVYDKRNLEHLPGNNITALHEDRKGNLWVGTQGDGLTCLDMKDGKTPISAKGQWLSNETVWSIYEDHEGGMWIGTDGDGLYHLEAGTMALTVYTTEYGLSDDVVWSVCEDRGGGLWIGTNRGLCRLKDGKFDVYTVETGLSDNIIRAVYEDRRGNLWIGTNNGLDRMKNGKFTSIAGDDGLAGIHIGTIYEDQDGNLWIGTNGAGLKRLKFRDKDGTFTLHTFTTGQGLSNDTIFSLYEDREKSLWIGTLGGGLNRLQDGKFTPYTMEQGLSHDMIWSVYEDAEGDLWIGTRGGLNRLDRRETNGKLNPTVNTTEGGFSNISILSVCKGAEGSLWIGTSSGGLIRLKDGKFNTYTTAEGLSDNTIKTLVVDREGSLWIGTRSGLNRLDRYKNKKNGEFTFTLTVYTGEHGLSNSVVRTIYEDKQGNLWIGTNRGLTRFKDGQFNAYTMKMGLSNAMINCVYEDKQGSLWIGTHGGGLNRLKDGKFASVTTNHGLFDGTVHWILDDDVGNFWMSCNKGIFRVNKKDLDDFCDGKKEYVHCVSYDEKDGMKSRECNGFGFPSGCKTRDGKLWFPTMKGVVMIDPNHIIINTLPPPVKIEKIVADNKELPLSFSSGGDTLVLPPGIERIEVRYTGLSFLAPGKVQFKYKLEGFDKDWLDVGTRRTAYYTGLPPGNFRFRVTACNNDGVWNIKGDSVSLYTKPYFHQTFWFYLLCGLLAVSMGYTAYRIRFRQLRKREQELEDLVEDRTDQLKKANIELETIVEDLREANEIVLREREAAESANQAKSEFLANMSHEIRTPMNAILGFSEILEKEISDQKQKKHLQAISSSGKTLLELINDILDLSRIEAGKMELQVEPVNPRSILNEIKHIFSTKAREKALDFQLETGPDLPETLIMDGLRLRQILLNLVGNAVKFTHSGFIKLAAHKAGPGSPSTASASARVDLVFSVQDTGIGIPESQQQSIFKPFTQQKGQRAEEFGGAGLGLTITRRLVEMMGGEISLQSKEGEGSTFRIILKNVAVSGVVVEPEKTDIKLDVEDIRFENASIVAADDEELNRRLLIEFLAHSPIDIIEAENGEQAVELTKRYRPLLVLMDMKMPVMDGCEACRMLKTDEELKQIPVIIITASALKEQRYQMEEAGCNGYLNKPVSKSDLIIELMNFLPYTYNAPGAAELPPAAGKEQPTASPASLSPEILAKLPELLAILQSDDLSRRREMLGKTLILDEIEDFSKEMKELDQRYRSGILSRWADRLYNDLQAFDPARIQATLFSFPRLMEEIKDLSGVACHED